MTPSPLARFFLINPTFAIVLVGLLVLGGLGAFSTMVRENNPDLAIPQATIATEWPGAAPEQVEKEVTKPLEDALRSLPGLQDYASSSRHSSSLVVVRFRASESLPEAMAALRAKVDEAQADFPRGVEVPKVEVIAVSDLPIMTLSLSGDVTDFALSERAEQLQRELQQLEGVRRVDLQGAQKRSLHVRLRPSDLRAVGLSPLQVRERLTTANQDLSLGDVESAGATIPVYLEGRIASPQHAAQVPLFRLSENRTIRLGEVADVFLGLNQQQTQTRISIGSADFRTGVSVTILKRSGADTLATIRVVRAFLSELQASDRWHPSLEVVEVSAEDEIIQSSLNDVFSDLGQGSLAMFVVLLLAMGWREASLAALAIPVTMMGALVVCHAMGYTLNVIVVIGMVLALGIMGDVFILVLEGIRHGMVAEGLSFPEAALNSARTFLLPVLSGNTTNIMAMIPLLAIGGIDGKFVQIIPIVAIICLVLSMILAFVAVIPLSGVVQPRAGSAPARPGFSDRVAAWCVARLEGVLRRGPLLNRRRALACLGVVFLLFILSLVMIDKQPELLYPRDDRRSLGITLLLRPDATFEDSRRVAEKAGEYLRSQPFLATVMTHAGEVSPFSLVVVDEYLQELKALSLVGVSATFVPLTERPRLAFSYVEELRAGLQRVLADEPGVQVRMFPDPGNDSNGDPVRIEVRGDDVRALAAHAADIEALLQGIPGLTDVRSSLGQFRPEARLQARSEALAFHGITEADLMEQARIALSSDKIGTFAMPGGQPDLDVQLGFAWPSRDPQPGPPRAPWELGSFSIATPAGEQVPAAALLQTRMEFMPTAIQHSQGIRAVTVRAKTDGTITAGEVAAIMEGKLRDLAAGWDSGFTWRIRGEVETAAETYASTGIAALAALVLVFATLALQFQSFLQPLIIMLTVPLGFVGVGIGYHLLNIPVSFPGVIGMIALIGIVVNNSILMVEVMNTEHSGGSPLLDAAARGAASRLRPILSSTVTNLVGLVPLALSSPTWYPLCMAVLLGLSTSTVLGFIVIPSLYVLLTRSVAAEGRG